MQVLHDMLDFISTLAFVDVVFFFAVLSLMLLIITLIYFVKENSMLEEEEKQEGILLEIAAALEEAEQPSVNLNRYEEEQEEKAIISYEELLKRKNDFAINYSEEENVDEELTIKKVDLNNLVNKDIIVKPEIKVSVISYEKEEAFLDALKRLQQTLN